MLVQLRAVSLEEGEGHVTWRRLQVAEATESLGVVPDELGCAGRHCVPVFARVIDEVRCARHKVVDRPTANSDALQMLQENVPQIIQESAA